MTDTVTCSTVASWPVVRTDWMDMVSGLAAGQRGGDGQAAQAAAAPATTHFQCRQQREAAAGAAWSPRRPAPAG